MTVRQRRKLIRHLRATLKQFGKIAEAGRLAQDAENSAAWEVVKAARSLAESYTSPGPVQTALAIKEAAAHLSDERAATRRELLAGFAELLGALR